MKSRGAQTAVHLAKPRVAKLFKKRCADFGHCRLVQACAGSRELERLKMFNTNTRTHRICIYILTMYNMYKYIDAQYRCT